MTLIGILEFDKGTKLEYSDPNWNNWGWKALIGISPFFLFAMPTPMHRQGPGVHSGQSQSSDTEHMKA